MNRQLCHQKSIGLAACICAITLASHAQAQFSNNGPNVPQLPATGGVQGTQLTPEQVRDVWALRGLRQRSRGGVKTGVPQFVPLGYPSIMGFPMMPMQDAQPPAEPPSTRKSLEEKRADLRAAREEQQRLLRERAEERKAQAAEARAAGIKAKAAASGDDK